MFKWGRRMNQVTDKQTLQKELQNEQFLLFKHSLTCPISAAAFREYEAFMKENPDFPSAWLAVQDARALSDYVQDMANIKHESPQAILFVHGRPKWFASHRSITFRSICEAVEKNKQTSME